jgi:hypothetical protein
MMFQAIPQKNSYIKTSKKGCCRHIRPNSWLYRQKTKKLAP